MSTVTATPASPPPADFPPLLLRFVGEPFLFANKSYGDELVLHFGERRLGPPRKTRWGEFRYEHGTVSLHLRGSAWAVQSGTRATVYSEGLMSESLREWLEQAVGPQPGLTAVVSEPAINPGARVTAVIPFPVERSAVTGFGLRVDLSDGSTIVAIPTPDDGPAAAPDGEPLPPLADWELHTPHGNLVVGPGREIRVAERGS